MPTIQNKLIRHQIFLERFAGTIARIMQRGIDQARDIAIFETVREGIDFVNTKRLQQRLQITIQQAMDEALDQIKELSGQEANFNERVLRTELENVVEAEQKDLIKALLNKPMPVGLAEDGTNRKIDPAFNKFSEQTAGQLTAPIRDAQITGGDVLIAAATITALTSGLFAAQARSLSRAGTGHSAQTAGEEVYKVNNEIKFVEWVSVLDSGTTSYCRAHDGRRYPVGVGPRPKAHYGCRSITRPLVPGVDYKIGEKIKVHTV